MNINHEIFQDYLHIFFSWPPVALILMLVFFFKFSQSIKYFLENLGIKKVGPVEFQERQRTEYSLEIDDELHSKKTELSEEQINVIENHIKNLSDEVAKEKLNSEQKDQLINYLIDKSQLFEFAYLNLFLVHNSKQALFWFLNTGKTTKENFLYAFTALVMNPSEREAIFNALLKHDLIVYENGMYIISEKGIRFLKFIGANA